MRISDWSSAVCSSDLHRPEHLPRDDLRETRNRVERAAQFVDQLADRIARIFGRGPAIGRFIALRPPRARAIAAKLAGSSEARRVGKSVSIRLDIGGRRLI